VNLAVSGARTGGDVVVPGVVGLQASVAKALLTARGLTVGITYTRNAPSGRVAAQSPGPGTTLPKGSHVTLVVGRKG
jgi:beta-lactam-binding protein with PASTA domain